MKENNEFEDIEKSLYTDFVGLFGKYQNDFNIGHFGYLMIRYSTNLMRVCTDIQDLPIKTILAAINDEFNSDECPHCHGKDECEESDE